MDTKKNPSNNAILLHDVDDSIQQAVIDAHLCRKDVPAAIIQAAREYYPLVGVPDGLSVVLEHSHRAGLDVLCNMEKHLVDEGIAPATARGHIMSICMNWLTTAGLEQRSMSHPIAGLAYVNAIFALHLQDTYMGLLHELTDGDNEAIAKTESEQWGYLNQVIGLGGIPIDLLRQKAVRSPMEFADTAPTKPSAPALPKKVEETLERINDRLESLPAGPLKDHLKAHFVKFQEAKNDPVALLGLMKSLLGPDEPDMEDHLAGEADSEEAAVEQIVAELASKGIKLKPEQVAQMAARMKASGGMLGMSIDKETGNIEFL